MQNEHRVIVRALITEKGTGLREKGNKYIFHVERDANKIEIKRAIEKIFSVHVTNVRTMKVAGKEKRLGRFTGYRPDWKKAVVSLQAGDTIELFEQV
jgi:large subunit ribosomal protein L23